LALCTGTGGRRGSRERHGLENEQDVGGQVERTLIYTISVMMEIKCTWSPMSKSSGFGYKSQQLVLIFDKLEVVRRKEERVTTYHILTPHAGLSSKGAISCRLVELQQPKSFTSQLELHFS
jgi:hypothetical protein